MEVVEASAACAPAPASRAAQGQELLRHLHLGDGALALPLAVDAHVDSGE